jgi:5'-nucleotidase (lipoprotein e(P4) family)
MKKIVSLLIVATLILSCTVKQPAVVSSAENENQDMLLLSVLWFQKSAEMKALYYQGYNIAGKSLAEKLQNRSNGKPGAVIMDIDETILDNSPSEVFLIENNVPFSAPLWKKWVNNASAEALPGALEFVKFAKSQNVDVFYVTNRDMSDELEPTIRNMNKLGFPFVDTLHMVLQKGVSSKEIRRRAIAEKYDILMLIGDNLADFDVVFDRRGEDLGFGAVDQNREKFGAEFIVLPNPMYGPWINAAIKDIPGENSREKMLNVLEGY